MSGELHDGSPDRSGAGSVRAQTSRMRQKRAQVIRACDSCRLYRIKCDNQIPCSGCKGRGTQCSNASAKSITLPQAHLEIERLRRKVQELELELHEERNKPKTVLSQATNRQHVNSHSFREGIRVGAGNSPNETWYGPSSLFYFIGRVSNFLGSTFPQTRPSDDILGSNPASTLLDEPTNVALPNVAGRNVSDASEYSDHPDNLARVYLSPTQEEYFLELYWQSYHTSVFPIINETEFKEHYRSLWTTHGDKRKPSPLVDIVIAISMQFGVSMLPASRQGRIASGGDATVAGRRYYLRCQKLLTYELESPSILTLQCQILCSVYLCCATFQNMSDHACGLVVRTAYMLGLHLNPPDTMPLKDREIRKRLWWAVYILDSKIGMKYGRPFLLFHSNLLPELPSQGLEAAMQAGSSFAPLGANLSWLSFHHEHAKLFLACRTSYTALYDKGDWDSLEVQAGFLNSCMKEMEEWVDSVPSVLKTKRVGSGHSFSTDSCALDIEPFAPLWLQRQRLLLELMYHNICIHLYRPFISFTSIPESTVATQMATKCALHAITLANILHQILSSTNILTGWQEAFQWQWNAAMTLVGFVLAYPGGASTTAAEKSIDTSITVLDIFGDSFAVAARGADVVRRLRTKINLVSGQRSVTQAVSNSNRNTDGRESASNTLPPDAETSALGESTAIGFGEPIIGIDEMDTVSWQNILEMAFGVDQWAEPQMLWPDMGGFGA